MFSLYGHCYTTDLQIIAEDFLDNKMSVKDFVQAYKQERVVRWRKHVDITTLTENNRILDLGYLMYMYATLEWVWERG